MSRNIVSGVCLRVLGGWCVLNPSRIDRVGQPLSHLCGGGDTGGGWSLGLLAQIWPWESALPFLGLAQKRESPGSTALWKACLVPPVVTELGKR